LNVSAFKGSHIAHAISRANGTIKPLRTIQLSSRKPERVTASLQRDIPLAHLLPSVPVDITNPDTLDRAFEGAHVVISLVGVLTGSPEIFEQIQWRGAENVAQAAKRAGSKLIHMSAIGANKSSSIPYARTKALGEEVAFSHCPDATVIRPSLVFGPGDGFFNVRDFQDSLFYALLMRWRSTQRFAQISRFLPFLPVFGDGSTKFQPVYVEDLASLVEIVARGNVNVREEVDGRIIWAGGPEGEPPIPMHARHV
jgi:uncharacterized protein YbjT (DUF2867 family)